MSGYSYVASQAAAIVHGWVSEEQENEYVNAVVKCYHISQTARGDWRKGEEYQHYNAIRDKYENYVRSARKQREHDAFLASVTSYDQIEPMPTDTPRWQVPLRERQQDWHARKAAWEAQRHIVGAQEARMPRYGYGFQ